MGVSPVPARSRVVVGRAWSQSISAIQKDMGRLKQHMHVDMSVFSEIYSICDAVQRAFSQRKYMNISEERKRELRGIRDPKKPLFLVGEHKSKYIPKPPKQPYGDAFNENYLKQKHMDVRPKQKRVKRFRATAPITVLQCTRIGHVNNTCPYFEKTGIYSIHEAEESAQSSSWPYRHSPQPYFNKQGTQGIFFNWNSN